MTELEDLVDVDSNLLDTAWLLGDNNIYNSNSPFDTLLDPAGGSWYPKERLSNSTAALLWDGTDEAGVPATTAAIAPPDDSTTLLPDMDMAAFSWDELAPSDLQDAFVKTEKGVCSLCDAGLCAEHHTSSIGVPQALSTQAHAPELAAIQQHATLAASASPNQQPQPNMPSPHQRQGRKRVRRRSGNREGWRQQHKAGHEDDGECAGQQDSRSD